MLTRVLLGLLLASTIFPNGASAQAESFEPYEEAAAYEVYSAVLADSGIPRLNNSKLLVIRQETFRNQGGLIDPEPPRSICLRPDPEWENVLRPAIDDFLLVNKQKWQLLDRLKTDRQYKFVELDKFFPNIDFFTYESTWKEFYRNYPGSAGYINLSAVGFNPSKTIAIVSIGMWCGGVCGEGMYHVLQKKDNKWLPLEWTGEWCSWVS